MNAISGLNYISVGLLLDMEDYLLQTHEYIVQDGIIFERKKEHEESGF